MINEKKLIPEGAIFFATQAMICTGAIDTDRVPSLSISLVSNDNYTSKCGPRRYSAPARTRRQNYPVSPNLGSFARLTITKAQGIQ